jgi:hypothetical protein
MNLDKPQVTCRECGRQGSPAGMVDQRCRNVARCNRRRAKNGELPYLDIDLYDENPVILDAPAGHIHTPMPMPDSSWPDFHTCETAVMIRQALEQKRTKQCAANIADYAFRDTVREARRRGYTADTIAAWTGLTTTRIYQIWGYRRI